MFIKKMAASTLTAMIEGANTKANQEALNRDFKLEDVMFFRRTATNNYLYTRWRDLRKGSVAVLPIWLRFEQLNKLQQYHMWLDKNDMHHLYKVMMSHHLGCNELVLRSVHRTCAKEQPVSLYDHYIMPYKHYARSY